MCVSRTVVVVNSLFAFIAIISLVAFVLLICQFTFTLFLLHKRRKRIPLQNLSYSTYPLVSHFPYSMAFFSRPLSLSLCLAYRIIALHLSSSRKVKFKMLVGSRSLAAITIRSNCYSLRYSAALPAISLFTCNLSEWGVARRGAARRQVAASRLADRLRDRQSPPGGGGGIVASLQR